MIFNQRLGTVSIVQVRIELEKYVRCTVGPGLVNEGAIWNYLLDVER